MVEYGRPGAHTLRVPATHEVVDGVDVDPVAVVVELEAAGELAPHRAEDNVFKRKPPWYS